MLVAFPHCGKTFPLVFAVVLVVLGFFPNDNWFNLKILGGFLHNNFIFNSTFLLLAFFGHHIKQLSYEPYNFTNS